MANTIRSPFGKADEILATISDDLEIEIELKNDKTIAYIPEVSTGFTLTLTANDQLSVASKLYVIADAIAGDTETSTITMSNNIVGGNVTIANGATSGQRRLIKFLYLGGNQFIRESDVLLKAAV